LEAFFPPEDPGAGQILAFLLPPRGTPSSSRKTVIEKINNVSASLSPYGEILKTFGFVPDRDKLILW
jgi:hypothetical protein